jgi:hypothetical protein
VSVLLLYPLLMLGPVLAALYLVVVLQRRR